MRVQVRINPAWAWAAGALLFYLPLLIPSLAVIEPDDLLNSELVYNRAIGALWRGDPSIAHAFLVGHVPILALSRLTQPLMALYALLPPLQAYVANDLIVRTVAAAGSYVLLRDLGAPRLYRHLLSALFAVSLTNTTFGLSFAAMPAALWLIASSSRWRILLLVMIGWNSSLYLSGAFFIAAAPFVHKFVLRRPFDRRVVGGLLAYAAGLLLGNIGLISLLLSPHPLWHRSEWALFPPEPPFPWKYVARPLLPYFALAAILSYRDTRGRAALLFGVFILAWYQVINHLPFATMRFPFGVQIDRFYSLWPLALLIISGIASTQAARWRGPILLAATLLAIAAALTPHQHLRQLARTALGRGGGYPAFRSYYHSDWYQNAKLDGPVVSVRLDPMAAPMNGVPSIDGYFPLYPLAYKHAFQRVHDDELIRTWGSILYANPDSNFCAARDLGARYVVSAVELRRPELHRLSTGELNLYRIDCPSPRPVRVPPSPSAAP